MLIRVQKLDLIHCCSECKMIHSVWKIVCQFFIKLDIIPHNSEIICLSIYPGEMKACIHNETYTGMFIAVLLAIAPIWKQPNSLRAERVERGEQSPEPLLGFLWEGLGKAGQVC